jgi:recombination protein RecR
MNPVDTLAELFKEFPGIGPRQAKRFVYYLMTRSTAHLEELAARITELKKNISTCTECYRFFTKNNVPSPLCSICKSSNRDKETLMVVSRDVDLDTIEKSHSFNGTYFVLGGTVPILEKNPETKIRLRELTNTITAKAKHGLKEVILAMNATSDGDNTVHFLEQQLAPLAEKHSLRISTLGRGISTGTELEYSDSETIKNALKNRG